MVGDASAFTLADNLLPKMFEEWFRGKGWAPRNHQLNLLRNGLAGQSTLLIAPTGAGKTLAGFLPSLVDLYSHERPTEKSGFVGVHTLYISPLKALAVDIARNLDTPVSEMGLDIRIETRTGDTPAHRRQRQKLIPPDILLTTPEQLALMLANEEAGRFFKNLRFVVLDELHSLVTSKRGDLLALGLARLRRLATNPVAIGLSATVAEPDELRAVLMAQTPTEPPNLSAFEIVREFAAPEISILRSENRVPWSGHQAVYALPDIYSVLQAHRTTLIFVNTRSQAERIFQEIWRINDQDLPIALHHGSLDVGQRRKVEAAMGRGELRAVVCTSTLDLGIDWGDVDLVITVGAPKGASRLAQRIGRANHRMDEPSKAILVPSNRFEVLECQAALDANYIGAQDTPPLRDGSLDVLAQHVMGMACAAPFDADELFAEVTSAMSYQWIDREMFDRVLDFVSTGGYALKTYERFARIKKVEDNSWRVSHPRFAQQYRLNVGTIVESPQLKVRLARLRGKNMPSRGGRVLGEVEEYFLESLTRGDTFLFSGMVLRFEGIVENEAYVTRANASTPMIPAYAGGKFPLSTFLADGVRGLLADPDSWAKLPEQVREWLRIQQVKSVLPRRDQLLIETFPRSDKFYMVMYPFEGRLAHQTLGMLLTRRLERMKQRPLGFVATDYSLAIWGLRDVGFAFDQGTVSLSDLFAADMLGDDLENWLADSWLLKRTFRQVAVISGLIERRHPGKEKTGRQVTVSSDLIYDVLREHEPDHILMQATWADASSTLLDIRRLSDMLSRIEGRIVHKRLEQISPLAVPVMLAIGRESIPGTADEDLLADASDALIAEAMGEVS